MIDMRELVKPNEQILWEGRPDKRTTVLEGIFNPFAVFAIIWGCIDVFIFGVVMFVGSEEEGMLAFLIPFLLLHAMPVWIYLFGVLGVFLRWKNARFMVTTNGLYISGGILAFNYEMKPWVDIGHITIHQGIFDRMFGVGDVRFVCAHSSTVEHSHGHSKMEIYNIREFKEVFGIVNNLQTDVYSDTMYPNAMRPGTNPGYNTQYTRPTNMR